MSVSCLHSGEGARFLGSLWRPRSWEGCVFPGGERALGEVPGNPKSYLPPGHLHLPLHPQPLGMTCPIAPPNPPPGSPSHCLPSPDQSPPLRTHWCWGTDFVFLKMEIYVLSSHLRTALGLYTMHRPGVGELGWLATGRANFTFHRRPVCSL